jgi:hypothetical protein
MPVEPKSSLTTTFSHQDLLVDHQFESHEKTACSGASWRTAHPRYSLLNAMRLKLTPTVSISQPSGFPCTRAATNAPIVP